MPSCLLSTRSTETTPSLPAGQFGVCIGGPDRASRQDGMTVTGGFRLSSADACDIDKELHRALVLAITGEGVADSVEPFRNAVLFSDDQIEDGNSCYGTFSFDALDIFELEDPGEYFLTASIGRFLSDTLVVQVR